MGRLMLAHTHRNWSAACWLGSCAAIDVVAVHTGHLMPVAPVAALLGTVGAVFTAGGWSSPDVDRLWAPGMPQRGYHWSGHRGWTHRFWFASVLWVLTGVIAASTGMIGQVAVYGLPAGWTSHLLGDMIFGRLRIAGRSRGLGWETGGVAETPFSWLALGVALFGAGTLFWLLGAR